jgi:cobalt-zinc-cadmium efflux system membrane fusion protein
LFLSPQNIAITITNTDHMHIELKVFESDISSLKKDQAIIFSRPNNPSQKYEAQIHLINPFIESENRTAMVHGHLIDEKQSKLFFPGMYIEAEILTANESLTALPQEAVVYVENEYFVLVRENTHSDNFTFKKVKVLIDDEQNGYIPILNFQDFKIDTEFLTKGAFNLIRD